MHRKLRWRFIAPLIGVVLSAMLVLPGTTLAATPAPPWQVGVGAQSPDKARQANFFFNRNITIDVGDTVLWTDHADEIHTVTFLAPGQTRADVPLFTPAGNGIAPNPVALGPAGGPSFDGSAYTNSGLLAAVGQQYSLTFSKAGDFAYICLVHSTMSGVIHVQPQGTPYPKTQAQYDTQSRIQTAEDLGQAAICKPLV